MAQQLEDNGFLHYSRNTKGHDNKADNYAAELFARRFFRLSVISTGG